MCFTSRSRHLWRSLPKLDGRLSRDRGIHGSERHTRLLVDLASLTLYLKYRGAIVVGTTYIMNGEGVHCAFDGLVKDAFVIFIVRSEFTLGFELIRRKGTIVSLENTTGVVPPMSPMKVKETNVRLLRPVWVD
jgi:hypothetical protein